MSSHNYYLSIFGVRVKIQGVGADVSLLLSIFTLTPNIQSPDKAEEDRRDVQS